MGGVPWPGVDGMAVSNRRNAPVPPLLPLVVAVICTLVVVAFGQDGPSGEYKSGPANKLGLRVELYSGSYSVVHGRSDWEDGQSAFTSWGGATAVGVHVEWNRFRLGTAIADWPVGWFATSLLPLQLGYTIWNHPGRYVGRIGGMVPEVAAELSVDWWNPAGGWDRMPVAARTALSVGADILGVGIKASAGVIFIQYLNGHNTNYGWVEHHGFSPSLELGFRIGTALLDLTRTEAQ
jgi:hypothetical protein